MEIRIKGQHAGHLRGIGVGTLRIDTCVLIYGDFNACGGEIGETGPSAIGCITSHEGSHEVRRGCVGLTECHGSGTIAPARGNGKQTCLVVYLGPRIPSERTRCIPFHDDVANALGHGHVRGIRHTFTTVEGHHERRRANRKNFWSQPRLTHLTVSSARITRGIVPLVFHGQDLH